MKNSVSATICSILHGGVLDTRVAHQLDDDALVGVSAVLELPLLVTRIRHVGLQVNLAAVSVVAIQRGGLGSDVAVAPPLMVFAMSSNVTLAGRCLRAQP